jgi:RNA polymerase sigma factor (sigma-70 family)
MQQKELIPHLFRTESGKITSVLCKLFSIEHIELAEDITSETFLQALETWPYNGLPENPTAWLYAVAKNKAKNRLLRRKTFADKVTAELRNDIERIVAEGPDLSDQNIFDSQLQMLFALCHPSIPRESQIALSLRILCGFGIGEIANAFLTNKETINKRILRAKEKLRNEKVRIEFPPEQEVQKRLETVLSTLYLLYNEGYYSESEDSVLREDLCMEAIRLAQMLAAYPPTNSPPLNALLALMYFHASRFAARKNANGELVLYDDQDESLWNTGWIAVGADFLQKTARGNTISKYHLEAGIAYWHTHKRDSPEKWENILQLYNHLLQMEYSPIAALNRTYALSKTNGKEEAIRQAEQLQLTGNPYYYALLGELYRDIDNEKARQYFEKAIELARTQADRETIQRKMNSLR